MGGSALTGAAELESPNLPPVRIAPSDSINPASPTSQRHESSSFVSPHCRFEKKSEGKMDMDQQNYNTDVVQEQVLQHISDIEKSEELLQMIIRSVQKSERRNSAKRKKRKRTIKTNIKANGSDADDEKKAYSRCSISFLFQVIQKVKCNPHYVSLVHSMGFGEVLQLDDCCVPRCFVKWIADNVDTEKEEITIGSKCIKLSPQAVTQTLGTPEGDLAVDSDEINGKAAFLAAFGLSEVPSIRYFGKKIMAKDILPDADFFVPLWQCL